jgi:predicted TIM-barrel fold metal-dependent hydrolase
MNSKKGPMPGTPPAGDYARTAAFRERAGLPSLIDVHTHFMPQRLLAAVWSYFDPNDPLLDEAWGLLAEAGVPVVTHCGSGPVAGRFTGPGPVARLMARHPGLRLVVAHLGMPEYAEFLDLTERHPGMLLDTTMAFTPFVEDGPDGIPFPPAGLPRLRDLGDRVLLGTDFPNIPYAYPDALEALEAAGLGAAWLRAVCHDNAARAFGI